MERIWRTTDIRGKMILLGTGTSVGVPTIGCGCEVCMSPNPKNKRTRSSVIFGLEQGNLLVDTAPDLHAQLIREGIGIVHAVLFTHEHVDHLYGLDDLRLFPFILNGPVALYCEKNVEERIRMVFDYAFSNRPETHPGATPKLEIRNIGLAPFEALETRIQPIRLQHGPNFQVLGFRIGNIAYCTDTNFISDESLELMEGLDVLVLDALRISPHPTHFCVEEALKIVERLSPKMTYLTHVSHELEYDQTNAWLPSGVELAYDGLQIPLS